MSAEIIATLVMGAALAGLILTQSRGLHSEIAGLRGDMRGLIEGMDRLESAMDRLREAIIAAARRGSETRSLPRRG